MPGVSNRDHACLGCQGYCAPDKVVCNRCWQNVTSATRNELYKAYDRGRGQGTPAHRRAVLKTMYEARGQYEQSAAVRTEVRGEA